MIKPYNEEESKGIQIQRMFNRIAPTYDRLNSIISLGLDKRWRRCAIEMLRPYQPQNILDVATGTGDLALELAAHLPNLKQILGIDISEEMMRHGADKVKLRGLDQIIHFAKEDCTQLTLPGDSFDAITIGFGIRNFENIPQAIRELYRVLRVDHPLVILELTEPRNKLLRWGYGLYTKHFIPWVGRFVSNDVDAYTYLPQSIGAVPQYEDMVDALIDAGFREAFYHELSPSTCAIYIAIK